MPRVLSWVCSVWQQLNSCLSRLGTPEALLGPCMFLSCPVLPEETQAILKLVHLTCTLYLLFEVTFFGPWQPTVPVPRFVLSCRWLARLWNVLVVPRIEDAVISRVTAKHSPLRRPSPSNKGLSPGQRAVVRAALNIVLNKAVLHSCPLDRSGAVTHIRCTNGYTLLDARTHIRRSFKYPIGTRLPMFK